MFYKNLNINGENYPLAVNISGAGAPTGVEGSVGMFYLDTDTDEVYKYTSNGWVLLLGDMETALDGIIAIQNSLIGGEST